MQPKIVIGFTDFIPSLQNFFCSILSHFYEVEVNNDRPDYLFFSTEDFGTDNKRFDVPGGPVKILFTGENRRPQNYTCNYAISFDHLWASWHYRLPLYVVDMWCIKYESKLDYPYEYILKNNFVVGPRPNFCGFVHRNGNNNFRNQFFNELSNNYKQVSSAGPLLNNTGYNVEGIGGKLDFFKTCKFALCFENSSQPGYVTEKILHAFYANTIPIYWGSDSIGNDFNEKAFINVGNYQTVNQAINRIREVDMNDSEYQRMLSEPKVPHRIPNDCVNLDNFLNWFETNVYQKRKMRAL